MENAIKHRPPRADETLEKARNGDQEAFARLVRAHKGMVFSIAYHMFGDPALAEDIAQEVFLQLYRNVANIESDKHVALWLRRVTGHRCIDQARKVIRMPVLQDGRFGGLQGDITEPGDPGPDRDVWMSTALRELVAALPPQQRLAVTLRYQEELDPSDIAEILDMPLNTVKSHLQRALAGLRSSLRERLGDAYDELG